MSEPVEYLVVPEIAAILKTSDRYVLDELRRKNLRGSRLGAGWRVDRADLDKYMAAKANVSKVRSA